MRKIKRILAATDFDAAIDYACDLADGSNETTGDLT
jgi:hypothetical protein